MRRFALAALFACSNAIAQQAVAPLPPGRMQPGYGVVEQVTPVQVREAPAAAGGSAASSTRPVYRLKVRMADGSVQYRDLDRPEFRTGEHVLLTNAGDVLPDFAQDTGDSKRGSTPPGASQDGARPAEGAIQGGTLAPGESGGTPDPARSGSAAAGGTSAKRLERCYQLEGSLREQCLADEASRTGAGPAAPSGSAPSRRD